MSIGPDTCMDCMTIYLHTTTRYTVHDSPKLLSVVVCITLISLVDSRSAVVALPSGAPSGEPRPGGATPCYPLQANPSCFDPDPPDPLGRLDRG